MTDVPQIFSSDDPRQGKLGELLGDVDWKNTNQFGVKNQGNQYDASGKLTSTGEGTLGQQEGSEFGGYTQKEGEVTGQEPGTYRQNSNRAARGGLLESGINQGRINTIAGRFANQRYWNTHAHTEAIEGFANQRATGAHDYAANVAKTLAEARATAAQENKEAAQRAADAAKQTGLSAQPATFGAPAGGAGPNLQFTADPRYPIGPNPNEPYPGYQAIRSGRVKTGKPAEPYPGYYARAYKQVK